MDQDPLSSLKLGAWGFNLGTATAYHNIKILLRAITDPRSLGAVQLITSVPTKDLGSVLIVQVRINAY